ncbi:dTMP kinase [Methyloglobulus sp.]|uniref:dTMP kinase n=1 Tax=Methyloglobulus sp. TaxID=2518622 RepID=UPI00398A4715
MNKSGKFITLEGGEGVGKTTNIPFIKNYLQDQNIPVIVTREPGGTRLAEKIRELLLHANDETVTSHAEILLIFAARAQHLNHVIIPALAQGHWVLCDRFTDATYAYQGGGRGMSLEAISWLENFVQDDLRPDITLLLDVPVETGMARAKNRGGGLDRFESERLQFFNQVRQAYLKQAQQYPERIKVIKAYQPLDIVQKAIVETLKSLLT